MKNIFWEVIFDDENRKMEIIGKSSNDLLLTNNVYEMQQVGMKVRCQTPDISIKRDEITLLGYSIEEGLYGRLLSTYETKTGKLLKRW